MILKGANDLCISDPPSHAQYRHRPGSITVGIGLPVSGQVCAFKFVINWCVIFYCGHLSSDKRLTPPTRLTYPTISLRYIWILKVCVQFREPETDPVENLAMQMTPVAKDGRTGWANKKFPSRIRRASQVHRRVAGIGAPYLRTVWHANRGLQQDCDVS